MVKRRTDGWERAPRAMVGRLLPSDNPVAEQVLEWTIQRDSHDIRQLMWWRETKRSSKDRVVLLNRALDLMDEIQHAMRRLDELR